MEKLSTTLFMILLLTLSACKTRNGLPKAPKREVPLAINIHSERNQDVNFINLDYYRFQVADELDQFLPVNFILVSNNQDAEVILDIHIDQFTLWPKDERISRRTSSRNVVVGQDAAGKPVYQTVTAAYDIVQVQRRSNARFEATLSIKGDPPLKFQKTFVPSYVYTNTYVDNIYGDQRALDPSVNLYRQNGFEPRDDEFLLLLSKDEMLRRLTSEMSKFYDPKVKAVK